MRAHARIALALTLTVALSACASSASVTCPVCPTQATQARQAPAQPPIDRPPVTTDRRRTLELMGVSKDGTRLALRVNDELMGHSIQVYDVEKGQVIKTYPYTPFTEKSAWRRVRRHYGVVTLGGASQRQPDSDLLIVGGDQDDWVVLFALRGERAVPYLRIPRLKGEDGTPASVTFKRIAWEPHGRYVIAIINQKVLTPRPFDSDHLEVFTPDPARLPFD